MSKFICQIMLALVLTLVALATTMSASAQTIPDLRGTWKGDSESIVLGGGNIHHAPAQSSEEPEFRSVPFTFTVDKQDGRRFSGTFASPRSSSKEIAVVARTGTIYMVDAEGFTHGTLIAPNQMELCYLKQSPDARLASCALLTKQP
jgi:hypothetical protein